MGEIQVVRKPFHGKLFDTNVQLFQSICKTALPHCELCSEGRSVHIEQILSLLQVIYKFTVYCTVYVTTQLTDIWARLYVNRRRAKSI